MGSENYYNKNAKHFFNETHNLDLTHLYNKFLNLIPESGSILDAGCGSGRDSKYFLNKGFSVTSFDSSRELVKLASKFIGKKVTLMSFEEMNFSDQFDGIWAQASLLHIKREDMPGVFRKLSNSLKNKGILYVSYKYGTKDYESLGREFTCFTLETFKEFLNQFSDLSVLELWKAADLRPERSGEYWLNGLLQKNIV